MLTYGWVCQERQGGTRQLATSAGIWRASVGAWRRIPSQVLSWLLDWYKSTNTDAAAGWRIEYDALTGILLSMYTASYMYVYIHTGSYVRTCAYASRPLDTRVSIHTASTPSA